MGKLQFCHRKVVEKQIKAFDLQREEATQAINCKRSSSNEENKRKTVQAKKSIRRMPWHWEPKKDVTNCDKLRGAVNKY